MDTLAEKTSRGFNGNIKSSTRIIFILISGIFIAFLFLYSLNPSHFGQAEGLEGNEGSFSKLEMQSREMITDTGNAPSSGPDLAITKTHNTYFLKGGKGVYTVTVTNVGSDPINGYITVTDQLPAGLSLVKAGGNGWNTCNGTSNIICVHPNTTGLISSTALSPLLITVTIDITISEIVTNTVSVTNTTDSTITNNTAKDRTDLSADLAVLKTVNPANPADGSVITYTLIVTNAGPNDTTNVVLTDSLPSKLSFNGYISTIGTYSPTNGRWVIGNLTKNLNATLWITATVTSGACGNISNSTKGLTSNLPDGNLGNNSSTASLYIKNTCATGAVKSTATGFPPINQANLTLKDSANHTHNTQTNTSGVYTFTDTPSSPLASGIVTITASKAGYQSKQLSPNPILVSDTVNIIPDILLSPAVELVVSKTDYRSTVVPNQVFTYTIGITNSGFLTAIPVVITDVLSSQLNYLTDSLIGASGVISRTLDHTRIWTLTTGLPPNQWKIFTLRAQVANPLASGTVAVTNTIHIAAPDIEENKSNNVAQDVDYTPNVSIIKSVSPTEARVNSRFAFTIQIQNKGKVSITGVTFSDTFPSYLTYYSGSTTKGTYGFNTSTRTFSASIGTMVPNEIVTITINMTVNSTVTTTQILNNTATVYYTHGDTSLSQNSNTISYRVIGASSLPGTGGKPALIQADKPKPSSGFWAALISAFILFVGGLLGVAYGIHAKNNQPEWSTWALRMGGLLVGVGLMFGALAWGLANISERFVAGQQTGMPSQTAAQALVNQTQVLPTAEVSLYTFQDHQTLPDYPVPTPTVSKQAGSEKPADTSSPVRLLIPSLGIDAVIKYVPFDGFSWLISGLQNEIAWMGDTSWPGLGSNTAMAGHVTLRNGADGPFRYLETLKNGDKLIVFTEQNMYTYQVQELKVVDDSAMSVVQPSENSILTLITCTGWDNALGHYIKRLVVFAGLVDTQPIATRGN